MTVLSIFQHVNVHNTTDHLDLLKRTPIPFVTELLSLEIKQQEGRNVLIVLRKPSTQGQTTAVPHKIHHYEFVYF